MDIKILKTSEKAEYQKQITHVVQSWQWGEFREKLGQKLLRIGLFEKEKMISSFQLTFHKVPFLPYYIGYLPKGPFPNQDLTQALLEIGKKEKCLAIKIEPDIKSTMENTIETISYQPSDIDKRFIKSPHPLFTKHNYILDLTKSEDQILKDMHPKFRYNIKIAQKHGVWVEERSDDEALKIHLKLYFETTKRQGYFGHDENYHKLLWQTLKKEKIAKILIAFYKPAPESPPIPLTSWMLFTFKNTLYYPYGGSSDQYKNMMSSNLVAWEAIKVGKKLNCQKFDLWGAGDPEKGEEDPFHGFTRFKKQIGAELVEYLGTYDLVFNYPLYWVFSLIDKTTPLKVFLLKLIGKT